MPETVSRKIRITNLGAASGPPIEFVNIGFTMTEGAQHNGNFVLTKQEVKKLGLSIGDEIVITLNQVSA